MIFQYRLRCTCNRVRISRMRYIAHFLLILFATLQLSARACAARLHFNAHEGFLLWPRDSCSHASKFTPSPSLPHASTRGWRVSNVSAIIVSPPMPACLSNSLSNATVASNVSSCRQDTKRSHVTNRNFTTVKMYHSKPARRKFGAEPNAMPETSLTFFQRNRWHSTPRR